MNIHSYAGIGSREISIIEKNKIAKMASILCERGYLLYSGGAEGSDETFEANCNGFGVSFRPWTLFNEHRKYPINKIVVHTDESIKSIHEYHPASHKLSEAGKKLMSRNYFQVNGVGFLPRVDFVVCCADQKNGEVQGGTGQAVRIAKSMNIPVINIRDKFGEREFNRIPYVECYPKAHIEANLDLLRTSLSTL